MRSLVIFALFFFVNSSFLRQLETVTISEATLGDDCVESTETSIALNLTLTAGAEVTAVGTAFKVTLTEGENKKIESECDLDADKVTFTCTDTLTSPAVGKYTLNSLTETPTTEGAAVNTFKFGDGVSAIFMIAETVTLATQQETAQTVDLKDDQKKSFKIALDTTTKATVAPAVFAGYDAKLPLSACTLSEDAATVTCNPTEDEMKDGEKYKIYYNKGCTQTDTGIEVSFENRSVFMTVSKIALIAFALLF